jgi:hypothetical protein
MAMLHQGKLHLSKMHKEAMSTGRYEHRREMRVCGEDRDSATVKVCSGS